MYSGQWSDFLIFLLTCAWIHQLLDLILSLFLVEAGSVIRFGDKDLTGGRLNFPSVLFPLGGSINFTFLVFGKT